MAAPRLLEQAGTGRRYIHTDALATRADMTEVKPAPALVPVSVEATVETAPQRGRPHKKKPEVSDPVPDPDDPGEETLGDLD